MSGTWPLYLSHTPGGVTNHVQRVADIPLGWRFDDYHYITTDDDLEGLIKLATTNVVEAHRVDHCPGCCLYEGLIGLDAACECVSDDDLAKGRKWLSKERRK